MRQFVPAPMPSLINSAGCVPVEAVVAVGYGTATPPEVATEPVEEETAGADPSEVDGEVSSGAELEGVCVAVPD